MKIYFATWLTDRSHGQGLTKMGAANRLGSYHFLIEQNISSPMFKEYVKTGNTDPRIKKDKK